MYKLHRLLSMVMAVAFILASVMVVGAQDPTPTPVAEEEMATEEAEVTADDEQTQQEMLQEFTPSIEVRDQVFSVRDGISVTVPELFATEDSWIVMHLDNDGAPGAIVGYTFVEAGPRYNVAVNLTEDLNEDTVLWAMLHLDMGEAGTFEFPGPDAPAQMDDEVVMAQFTALEPGILVSNQEVTDNMVTVEAVVSAADSWLAIRRGQEGAPGEVIGYAPIAPGVTPNVSVELTGDLGDEETLWATLHYDSGVKGEFEFPGDDETIAIPEGNVQISFVINPEGADGAETVASDVAPLPLLRRKWLHLCLPPRP